MIRPGLVLGVFAALVALEETGLAQESADSPPALRAVPPPSGPGPSPLICPPQDRNETLLWGNPLLDPPTTPPGWFASLGVDVVGPAIKQRVRGQVLLGDA